MDGAIYINRSALPEPPNARTPSGKRRRLSRSFIQPLDAYDLLEQGVIQVNNASGTWMIDPNGTDIAALRLLGKILHQYQISGIPPEKEVWFC